MTGLQNITASDLLFSGNRDSAAPSIVSGEKTQTRQRGDASADVRRKLKMFFANHRPEGNARNNQNTIVFCLFFFTFFALFLHSYPMTLNLILVFGRAGPDNTH